MKIAVWIVAMIGDRHWKCVEDAARGIAWALGELGHGGDFSHGPTPPLGFDHVIAFNAQNWPPMSALPGNVIIFNAEQVPDGSPSATPPVFRGWDYYLARMRKHLVWDYSRENLRRLSEREIARTAHCAIGFWPGLVSPALSIPKTTDVLFIGSMNARRKSILDAIEARGLKVERLFGCFDGARDAAIARARLVLNIHFYERPIWEIFRCSHLLANRCAVVTESGGTDPDLERIAADCCASYARADEIPERCEEILRDPHWIRLRSTATRFELEQNQIDHVRAALEQSGIA